MPVYNDYRLLPTSFDRSKGVWMELTNYTNTMGFMVEVTDNQIGSVMFGIKPAIAPIKPVYVTVSSLVPTKNADLKGHLDNYSWRSIEGKTFIFINEIIFIKKVSII
ncbi:MAG TPA: hypothetical protein VFF27_18855 [Bacteroidia bacterium]|jgi:hypothetical protein|nr:hypothetical protein [Bacteroidia bacterium]